VRKKNLKLIIISRYFAELEDILVHFHIRQRAGIANFAMMHCPNELPYKMATAAGGLSQLGQSHRPGRQSRELNRAAETYTAKLLNTHNVESTSLCC